MPLWTFYCEQQWRRARAAGLKPDEYQGLYIDDSTIDTLLTDGLDAGLWPGSNSAETDPSIATSQVADQLADVEAAAPNESPVSLLRLAQAFNLSPADVVCS